MKTDARPGSQIRPQHWTRREEERLHALKANNRTWAEIAHRLQRSIKSCRGKWDEIKTVEDLRSFRPEMGGDDAYVAACWAEGGFPYRALLRGQVYTIWPTRREAA